MVTTVKNIESLFCGQNSHSIDAVVTTRVFPQNLISRLISNDLSAFLCLNRLNKTFH